MSGDDLKDALERLAATSERLEYLKPEQCRKLLEAALRHDAETFAETRDEHAGKRDAGTTPRHPPVAPFVALVLLTGCRFAEVRSRSTGSRSTWRRSTTTAAG